MNKDIKLIFENYKLVKEQQNQNVYLNLIVNAINSSKDIAPEVKKKMVEYFSQVDNAEGLKSAIEAGQNETADIQTGQAFSSEDMPAQDNRSGKEMMGPEPTGPRGQAYDEQGNLVDLENDEQY